MPLLTLPTFLSLLHSLLFLLSASAAYTSYRAITQLQQYESTSEKAAKISDKARSELATTRSTHTQGALAILLSLMISLFLMFNSPTYLLRRILFYSAAIFNLWAAQYRMGNFWAGKKGRGENMMADVVVPGGYQKGVELSKGVIEDLRRLGFGWGAVAVVWGIIYVSGGA